METEDEYALRREAIEAEVRLQDPVATDQTLGQFEALVDYERVDARDQLASPEQRRCRQDEVYMSEAQLAERGEPVLVPEVITLLTRECTEKVPDESPTEQRRPDAESLREMLTRLDDLRAIDETQRTKAEWTTVAIADVAERITIQLVGYVLKSERMSSLLETDVADVSVDSRRRLCMLRWISSEIASAFGDGDAAQAWLLARNPVIDFRVPLRVIRDADDWRSAAFSLAPAVSAIFA